MRNMGNESKNPLWKEHVDKRLSSKEESKALWDGIFDKFESESGGEPLLRAFIRERFDSLESSILSKIEEIKKKLPEE